jgi:hypothetical protein
VGVTKRRPSLNEPSVMKGAGSEIPQWRCKVEIFRDWDFRSYKSVSHAVAGEKALQQSGSAKAIINVNLRAGRQSYGCLQVERGAVQRLSMPAR